MRQEDLVYAIRSGLEIDVSSAVGRAIGLERSPFRAVFPVVKPGCTMPTATLVESTVLNPQQKAWLQILGVPEGVLNADPLAPPPGTKASSQQADAPAEVADLPQPVAADCKPARGRVPGPAHHLYCSTHGHVLDVKAKTIIARDLGDYKKRYPALVAANARAAQTYAAKPAKTVNMEEAQITGRSGTSMHLPTKAEDAKAKADAKRKVDADAHASREAERKHGELEKHAGNIQVQVSILVEEVYGGTLSGLKISGIATSDRGKNVGQTGVAQFVEKGIGLYVVQGAWLPPSGMMDFNVLANSSGRKGPIKFTQANYVCEGKGAVVKFKAVERPDRGSSYHETAFSTSTSKSYSVSGGVSSPLGPESSVSAGGGSEDGMTQTTGSSVDNIVASNVFDVRVDR